MRQHFSSLPRVSGEDDQNGGTELCQLSIATAEVSLSTACIIAIIQSSLFCSYKTPKICPQFPVEPDSDRCVNVEAWTSTRWVTPRDVKYGRSRPNEEHEVSFVG
jgi:hypothetical protein